MAYKIVFFDIDGTLVNDEKIIPADTVEAVRTLQSNGVEAVIATGRAPYFFKHLLEELGINSYVCLNGAYVVYKGAPLYKRTIPPKCLEELANRAAAHNHPLVFEGGEAFFANAKDHPHVVESIQSLRVKQPEYDPDYWKKNDIYQVFLHCQAHEEQAYVNGLDGLRLVRWHDKAMDVMPESGSKAQGIIAMLQRLGIKPEETVAFGDGLNDIEMLSVVGLGIAMGNSHADVKPYADYVTTPVDEGGIRNGLRYAGLI